MTSNQTICDLCPTSVASERLHEANFSTLSVQGSARNLVQSLAGPGATTLDLCPACGNAVAEFLHARKNAGQDVPGPADSSPSNAAPASVVDQSSAAELHE